nr:MAG TPA: hypothetical protein [Caudoviricetes sp.]
MRGLTAPRLMMAGQASPLEACRKTGPRSLFIK